MLDVVRLMNEIMRMKCLGSVQTNQDNTLKVVAFNKITKKSTSFDIDENERLDVVLNRIRNDICL